MAGDRDLAAKATALALLDITRKEHRPYAAILFSSCDEWMSFRFQNSTVTARKASGEPQKLTLLQGIIGAAPEGLPSPASVTVTATSQADATKSASASVAITSDVTLSIQSSPAASSIQTGATIQLAAMITSKGHPDNTVAWSVDAAQNGNATVGTIATTGANTATYTAPAAVPSASTVTITATSAADPSKSASTQLTVGPR
jgi:hypothetical protein